jgi:L-rhamnose isomerase
VGQGFSLEPDSPEARSPKPEARKPEALENAMDWPDLIARQNERAQPALEDDYAHLGTQLARRGVDIEAITRKVMDFRVAVPSWGVGTGGTRFARFPDPASRGTFTRSSTTAPSCSSWCG